MKIRIFISSVQKELADERLATQILLTTDPFLSQHCIPILFEQQPASLTPSAQAYLNLLDTCQVYIGIIWKEYGTKIDGLSATHHEYRHARKAQKPTLIAIRGDSSQIREPETIQFIDEILQDKHTYSRFTDTEVLQKHVRERLIKHIKDNYHLEPTSEQETSALQTMSVTSSFERQRLEFIDLDRIDTKLATDLAAAAEEKEATSITKDALTFSLWTRGFLWKNEKGIYLGTSAGILLMAKDPSAVFPHSRIQLSAFSGITK